MKFLKIMFALVFSCISSIGFAQSLYNYLGNNDPRLQLELSSNGANWGSFTIDYQSSGTMPTPQPYDSSNAWSSWNVKDTSGNYYGTITLSVTSADVVTWDSYTAPVPATGYYLTGINLCAPNSTSYKCSDKAHYSLIVDKVVQPTVSTSPFPNAPVATAPQNFSLSASGNKILLNNTTPVRLKGVARPSLEWNNQGQYLSTADITNMHSFGADMIRLDLNADYWNNSAELTTQGSYKQIVDAIIYYAQQNNMVVILDYHWSNDQVQQQAMAPNNTTSTNFWKSVASKYKNFDNVIFELYNEPHDITTSVWLNGDSSYLGMQQMYDLIRSQGANNLVIANGLDYGYYLGFLGVSNLSCNSSNCFIKESNGALATNVIYGSHPYDTKGSAGYTYNGLPADFNTNFAGVKNVAPVIFTEFGDNKAADYNDGTWETVYNNDLSEINNENFSYSGFAWWIDDQQPSFPALITGSWDNPVPNNYAGSLIFVDMLNNPGTVFSSIK